MKIIYIVLLLTFRRSDRSLSSSHENILKQILIKSGSAEAKFNLARKTVPYAICSCHCTYTPIDAPGLTTPTYPKCCMHCPTPGIECGMDLLLVGADDEHHPRKTFLYHNLKDYFAGLLS
jgi:hypothetical protein